MPETSKGRGKLVLATSAGNSIEGTEKEIDFSFTTNEDTIRVDILDPATWDDISAEARRVDLYSLRDDFICTIPVGGALEHVTGGESITCNPGVPASSPTAPPKTIVLPTGTTPGWVEEP